MAFERRGLAALALLLTACSGDSGGAAPTGASAVSTPSTASTTTSSGEPPALYRRFSSHVSVSRSGDTVVLRSDGVPEHKSPYFGAGHALYEPPHAGMAVNPFRIMSQNFELRVPASPRVAASASATPLGAIGITTTGIALFNQYAAGFQPLDDEIRSFDLHNGHPQGSGQYHHHFEPVEVTRPDRSALVGVLLDGFAVYGPLHLGGVPGDLDECNGHTAATADSAEPVYHYHTTTSVPYISGCFRGSRGTASN